MSSPRPGSSGPCQAGGLPGLRPARAGRWRAASGSPARVREDERGQGRRLAVKRFQADCESLRSLSLLHARALDALPRSGSEAACPRV